MPQPVFVVLRKNKIFNIFSNEKRAVQYKEEQVLKEIFSDRWKHVEPSQMFKIVSKKYSIEEFIPWE